MELTNPAETLQQDLEAKEREIATLQAALKEAKEQLLKLRQKNFVLESTKWFKHIEVNHRIEPNPANRFGMSLNQGWTCYGTKITLGSPNGPKVVTLTIEDVTGCPYVCGQPEHSPKPANPADYWPALLNLDAALDRFMLAATAAVPKTLETTNEEIPCNSPTPAPTAPSK